MSELLSASVEWWTVVLFGGCAFLAGGVLGVLLTIMHDGSQDR